MVFLNRTLINIVSLTSRLWLSMATKTKTKCLEQINVNHMRDKNVEYKINLVEVFLINAYM